MNKELIQQLRQSAKKHGNIYPVILAKNGSVIDGFHRLEANPNWQKLKLPITDKAEITILRLLANWRRKLSKKEKTEMFDAIAQETGWTPKQIAEETGISYTTVKRYISDKYKGEYVQTKTTSPNLNDSVQNKTQVTENETSLDRFLNHILETIKNNPGALEKNNLTLEQKSQIHHESIKIILNRGHLFCPVCGCKEIKWGCGHEW